MPVGQAVSDIRNCRAQPDLPDRMRRSVVALISQLVIVTTLIRHVPRCLKGLNNAANPYIAIGCNCSWCRLARTLQYLTIRTINPLPSERKQAMRRVALILATLGILCFAAGQLQGESVLSRSPSSRLVCPGPWFEHRSLFPGRLWLPDPFRFRSMHRCMATATTIRARPLGSTTRAGAYRSASDSEC